MLPDQSHLRAEVAADVAKVRKALDTAISAVGNSVAAGSLNGMRPNIDDWAKRGTDAAATRDKTPGPNGWPGWTKAGTVYLDGIEDIARLGKHDKLDAITATVREIPKTTIEATAKAADAVANKAKQAATSAVHTLGDLGSGFGKLLTRAALAAAAAAVLLIVLRKSV